MFAFSKWHERISVKKHSIENRFVIGPESVLFCRLVPALFSPEISPVNHYGYRRAIEEEEEEKEEEVSK